MSIIIHDHYASLAYSRELVIKETQVNCIHPVNASVMLQIEG